MTAGPATNQLVDPQGRVIRKLRLSLTDRCQLRCRYCMPVAASFLRAEHYLRPEEYRDIVAELAAWGIRQVRLTGGEPLLRQEFPEIVTALATIPSLELSLTTNGLLLPRYLPLLKQVGLCRINISLDTLQPETFYRLTHRQGLEQVTQAIAQAVQGGFQVKLNMVVMRHINDQELSAMVTYGQQQGVAEVRFLELMRVGYACHLPQDTFVSAQEMQARLQAHYQLTPIPSPPDSTVLRFRTNSGFTLGFMASESQPFCGSCSRWRLSADGVLRACLFREEGISLRGLDPHQRQQVYQQLLGMKPRVRGEMVAHAMYQIGG